MNNQMEKPRKSRSGVVLFFILMPILMMAVMAAPFLLQRLEKPSTDPIYVSASLGEEATARAYVWLNKIEDMPLSYAEVRDMMGDIQLTLVQTPTGEKKKYIQTLAEGSYEECLAQAQSGLEQAYRDVVRYRFLAAGYEEELTDDMLDERMREAYGVSVAEYLAVSEIQLLPTLEEVTEMYTGEVTYE